MPSPLTLTIEAHRLEQTTGHWCDHCALPSVTHHDVAIVASASLRVLQRRTYRICDECDRGTVEVQR